MEDNDRKTREFQTNLQKQNTEFYTEMKQSKKERDEAIKERDKWRQNYAAEVRRNAGGVGAVNEVFGELNGHNSENELGGLQRSATSPPGKSQSVLNLFCNQFSVNLSQVAIHQAQEVCVRQIFR